MDFKKLAKNGLEYTFEKKYEKLLAQKRVSYEDWIVKAEESLEHFNLSVFDDLREVVTENTALKWDAEYTCKYGNLSFRIVSMDCCGFGYNVRQYIEDIIVFINGRLSEITIPLIADYFENHQRAIVLYGDEDIISADGKRTNPYFKPDFSPNELLSHFYFCNIVAVRRSAFREYDWTGEMKGAASLYHNLLRIIYSDRKYIDYGVGHVKGVLVHCQDYANRDITDAFTDRFTTRVKVQEIASLRGAEQKISVVICTKDHPDMLENCLSGLESFKGEFSLEYIIVDNGSTPENRAKINDLSVRFGLNYIYEPSDFNFSKMCNMGAEASTSPMLLFLNDDVEFTEISALQAMWKEAEYSFTGAVGLKLLYPGDSKIQHAGIVNTPFGPVHKLQGLSDTEVYYHGFNRSTANRIAVTGACLMIRKDVFNSIGGFDVDFPVAYNDVDLCYKLLEQGLYIACCSGASAIHRESVTRGADVAPQKAERLKRDRERLLRLHAVIGREDPFYNSYLLREALDVRIVPGNEYTVEQAGEIPEKLLQADLSGARKDACLMVSVEYAGLHSDFCKTASKAYLLQGYGVLTGSNNACYQKEILLEGEQGTYAIAIRGCIRNDIAAALSSERNVELSGFALLLPAGLLPAGTYRIGLLFKRELSKEKIYNFTDKILVVKE